jgi:hypothetical protein
MRVSRAIYARALDFIMEININAVHISRK